MFQELFSGQKVSNISFKIEFSLQLQYHPVYTKAVKQFVQNNKNAYVCKHTHFWFIFLVLIAQQFDKLGRSRRDQ